MKSCLFRYFLLLLLLSEATCLVAQPKWPAITQQTKPWTRWWWMGSAVNPKDLTHLLEQYQKAGLGGVEITPIYGVKGAESQFINFLSPTWMDRLTHTLSEANRLGMGVDLAQASGWPFGGPWVSSTDACKYVTYQTYALKGGENLKEPIRFVQKPIVRTIGQPITLDKLVDPIAKNPDLQLHAFDQVRFEKPLPLQALVAYAPDHQPIQLTEKVDAQGRLNWTAPAGDWTLYAVFEGWHGKMVERAGPGGEGDVIDHFSKAATEHYLKRFDEAFKGRNVKGIRAFFNDSYEVDDAQGEGNWTPNLFAEFQKRRGYDLRNHLPDLFGATRSVKNPTDKARRVLSDYRETISELLLENYTQTWHDWAHSRGTLIRNQAHGSPANILDLYAVTDIPEIEGKEILRIKFASSAAHVTGKKLTSSESATWDNEHFLSKLSDIKRDIDLFLLGGVNHTFYHGTNYSPQSAAWPGWLFYAAVHFNPNNSFWTDFSKLNQYVARCQSFLQMGKPSNDVLLYLPIYDAYTLPGKELLQHFDGLDKGFNGLPIEEQAKTLWEKGYGFDYISDKQLLTVTNMGNQLLTGGNAYRAIMVPAAQYLPLPTLKQLLALAERGATIVFGGQLPIGVPGLENLDSRQEVFQKLLTDVKFAPTATTGVQRATVGKGTVWVGEDVERLLTSAGLKRETMADQGLRFIRRSYTTGNRKGQYYFIANMGDKTVDGWVPLHTIAKSVALYNPMTEQLGMAQFRTSATGTSEVYLQLTPGESCLLETSETTMSGETYAYYKPTGNSMPLTGKWKLQFVSGGPKLPAPVEVDKLGSWTELNDEGVKQFSGSATYTLSFAKPAGTGNGWLLDLGKVAESASVQLNGQNLGTLIGPTYQVFVPGSLLRDANSLVVTVSNSMANRIIDMDQHKQPWKIFYNINMSPRLREDRDEAGLFTAERWQPKPSGLLGPVTLTPVSK
ncbi:glycosyl hydrolase [Spirosoma gilvum]